jgi:CheY-like chemotaxis protein
MKVLVVDDDKGVRNLMSIMLANLGHECVVAANGLEAVTRFAADRHGFHLIITDLNMPLMDGYEAIREIRRLEPGARIVSMSANCTADPPSDTPFLEKPFTFAALQICLALAMAGGQPLRIAS